MRLLLVCGEPSGDVALGRVLAGLTGLGVPFDAAGLVGDRAIACGARPLAHVRDVSGMGLFELAGRLPPIVRALAAVRREVLARRPDVAVLASWSAGNARIGAWLRRRRVPVVWISPPEVWAWGAWRRDALVRAADRLLVTLPFEEALWRAAGADARYVGHPALDFVDTPRAALRAALGLDPARRAVAILPGSRPTEIARLAPSMLGAVRRLGVEARLVLAPSLSVDTRDRLRGLAADAGVAVLDAIEGASAWLPAFDAALVASGTASLECALAGAAPVIAYRLHAVTAALARRLLRIERVGLPNVVLARAGHAAPFRERLQEAASVDGLAAALGETLDDPALAAACRALESTMRAPLEGDRARTFGARAAESISALVGSGASPR